MPTLVQLIAGAAGLAWVVVIVAAIKVIGATLAAPTEAPPPGNSDWYLVMQGPLWTVFLAGAEHACLDHSWPPQHT